MRPCTVCGNEIDERVRTCPFCEQPQGAAPPAASRRRPEDVPTINVKDGQPTVAAALQQLQHALQTRRLLGSRVVRIVHGWGASGRGGAIRLAVRRQLAMLRERGTIRSFVAGEDYSELDEPGRVLLQRHSALRSSLASDRLNRGITIVEL